MANKIVAFVKANPKKTALFVAVAAVGIFYVTRAKGAEQVTQDGFTYGTGQYTEAQMAYGVQMQQMQSALTSQTNQLNAGLAAIDATNAHTLEMAQLEAHTQELGITTAYNIALLESQERIHGLDTAADVQRQQNMLAYTLSDKSLNYQNEQATAQNAILASMADYSHLENMTALGNEKYMIEAQERYGMKYLQTTQDISKYQMDAVKKIAQYTVGLAEQAAFWDTVGGIGSALFGAANRTKIEQQGSAVKQPGTSGKGDPGTNNQSGSDAGSNKKGGTAGTAGGFAGWF